MAIKYLNNISLENNEIQNVKIQNLATDPVVAGQGQIIFNTSSTSLKYYDGANWIGIGSSSGSVTSVSTGEGLTGGPISTSGTISLKNAAAFTNNAILKWDNTGTQFVDSSIVDNGSTVTITGGLTVTGSILGSNLSGANTGDQVLSDFPLDTTNLVVVPESNIQDYAEGVDHSLLKARGTGVSTTYVSTVVVGGTTFSQPAVSGEIHSDQGYFDIHYTGATNITVTNLNVASVYVYIDNSGALQQQTSIPTRQDWSRKMFTMRIAIDLSNNTIIGFEYLNNPIGHYANSIRDVYTYLLAQGVPFKKDQVVTGRATDLGFDVSAGSIMEFGGTGDIDNANIITLNAVSNATFFLATRTAFDSGTNTDLPKFWDNNGVLTALGSTTLVGHRLYRFSNGNLVMQYGQGNYANMTLAKAGVVLEDYVLNPILKNATFFGWWFVESTATNTGGTTLTDFVEYTIGLQGGSSSSLSGALLKGNNLSDLLDVTTARTNLGVKFEDGSDPLDAVYNDGNVGIGTTAPSEKLEVSGNIKATTFVKDGGTASQFLKADGSVDSSTYQSTLVSGTNIKTINGSTILGSGNLVIDTTDQWGDIAGTLSNQTDLQNSLDDKQNILVSGTNIKTVGGTTILGSGNISLGVTSIVAGTNITIFPPGGTGAVTINSSGGGTTWGSITGTLSSQTDLNTALDNTTLIQTSVYSGTYSLILSDRDTNIENNDDLIIEIPLNSSVAFPIGTQIFFTKKAETITFAPTGTQVNSVDGLLEMGRINCGASLLKVDTDEWNLIGELV